MTKFLEMICSHEEDSPLIANRYKIIEKCGQGGCGIVYKAEDILENKIVALKQCLKEAEIGSNAKVLFERESLFHVGLDHKNIARAFEVVKSDDASYLPVEYVENSFDEYEKDVPLRRKIKDMLTQVLPAIAYIAKNNLVHGDIKPDNIRAAKMDNDYQLKLIDFGFAGSREKPFFLKGFLPGTPNYIAPEAFWQEKRDSRTDVYAFGRTLCRIIFPVAVEYLKVDHESTDIGKLLKYALENPSSNSIENIVDEIQARDSYDLEWLRVFDRRYKKGTRLIARPVIDIIASCLAPFELRPRAPQLLKYVERIKSQL